MIYTYKECIEKYGSDYLLKKAMAFGSIRMIEKGLYSDSQYDSERIVIQARFPQAVFAGESAFYYHNLTDVVPDTYTLAIKRSGTRINDIRIRQLLVRDDLFDIGIQTIDYDGDSIRIYDVERMLLELIRLRKRYSLDFYKEIISNYRNRIHSMDFMKLEEYASKFSNGERLLDTIQLEVM